MVIRRTSRTFRDLPPTGGRARARAAGPPSAQRAVADRGQAVPLVAAALALVAVLAVGVARLGGVASDRARAHTAADAAALAGASEGRSVAVDVAQANGGTVVSFRRVGDETEVRVRVGEVEAVARARLVRGAARER